MSGLEGTSGAPARRSLFSAWRAVMSVTLLAAVTGFLASTLAARALGAAGYGTFAVASNSLAIMIALATMGYPMAILRFGPRLLADGAPARFAALVGSALKRTSLLALGLLLCGLVALQLVPSIAPAHSADVFALILLALPAAIWAQVYTAANRALGHLELALLPDAIARHLVIIAVGAWLLLQYAPASADPLLFAGAYLAGTLVSAVLIYAVYVQSTRRQPPADPHAQPDPAWFASALGFFSHYVIGTVRSNADILVLAAMTTTREAGIYAISLKLSEILSSVAGTLNFALSPRISVTSASGNTAEMQADQRVAAWVLTALAVFAGVPLILWASTWLSIFGPDFAAGVWPLRVVVLGAMITCLAGPTYQVLALSGNEWLVTRIESAGLATQLVLLAVLVSPFGALGAAIARCVSVLLPTVLAWVIIRQRFQLTLGVAALLSKRFSRRLS
jgi:O-antigen/teichoic acid export membrane protein